MNTTGSATLVKILLIYMIPRRFISIAIGYIAWWVSAGYEVCIEPWDGEYFLRYLLVLAVGGMIGGCRPLSSIWSVPLELAIGLRMAYVIWDSKCGMPGDAVIFPVFLGFLLTTCICALPLSLIVSGTGAIANGRTHSEITPPFQERLSEANRSHLLVAFIVGVLLCFAPWLLIFNLQAISNYSHVARELLAILDAKWSWIVMDATQVTGACIIILSAEIANRNFRGGRR